MSPPHEVQADIARIDSALDKALEFMPVRAAVDLVSEMLDTPRAVIFDCRVDKDENCLPMIPSGKPHNEMILPDFADDIGSVIDAKGREMV